MAYVDSSKKNTVINASNIKEAVEKITELYNSEGICLGDILASIELKGFSVEDIITITAEVRNKIDDWELVYITDTDEYWSQLTNKNGSLDDFN